MIVTIHLFQAFSIAYQWCLHQLRSHCPLAFYTLLLMKRNSQCCFKLLCNLFFFFLDIRSSSSKCHTRTAAPICRWEHLLLISNIRGQGNFFQPASQTVGFSLQLKNPDHVIIFFWLCGFENTDRLCYSFILSTAAKSVGQSSKGKISTVQLKIFTETTANNVSHFFLQ